MRGLLASIVVASQLAMPVAHADPTEAAARVHLDRGVEAFRAGDFVRAHRELRIAHELAPDKPNPYRWLALTEVQLGDCARALVDIDGFLARVPPDDPRRPEMIRWRELCARTGVVHIDSTPPSATLRIDGALVGTTPYRSLSMRAGAHTLVADKPGHRSASRSIVVQPGGELDVRLELARAHTPLIRRWWFWPAVGAVALTVTGVVVVAATREGDALLPPITCGPAGCAP